MTKQWLVMAVMGLALGACGDDEEDTRTSEARRDDVIASYCMNAAKCGIRSNVDSCIWERTTRFNVFFGGESAACRAAELDEYQCYGAVACDDFEFGCDDAEEATDDACAP